MIVFSSSKKSKGYFSPLTLLPNLNYVRKKTRVSLSPLYECDSENVFACDGVLSIAVVF